jgi:hypothetical protein
MIEEFDNPNIILELRRKIAFEENYNKRYSNYSIDEVKHPVMA